MAARGEKVVMVGYYDDRSNARSFRPLTIEGEHDARELAVFSNRARAKAALEGLGYNPEMVRLKVPMEKLGTVEVPFAKAMRVAGSLGCAHVGVDVVFGDVPYRRFPVSPASG